MAERLGAKEWIEAALRALGEGGVQAVRVEVLARRLGVTKGSFYWHFKDRKALLDATLEYWQSVATHAVIAEVDSTDRDPEGRLRHLYELCTAGRGDLIESKIRAWAMSSPEVQQVLAKIDATRERFVADILQAHGLPRAEAKRRARALYLALIGEFTWVSHGGRPTAPAVWRSLIDQMLGSRAAL